jgi:hypothetical protein
MIASSRMTWLTKFLDANLSNSHFEATDYLLRARFTPSRNQSSSSLQPCVVSPPVTYTMRQRANMIRALNAVCMKATQRRLGQNGKKITYPVDHIASPVHLHAILKMGISACWRRESCQAFPTVRCPTTFLDPPTPRGIHSWRHQTLFASWRANARA